MEESTERREGVDMAKTIEDRVEALELARRRDDDLIKAAAGQLRKVKEAKDLEDVKQTLLIVAGQLEAVGKGG
jgi:hypothetical protein